MKKITLSFWRLIRSGDYAFRRYVGSISNYVTVSAFQIGRKLIGGLRVDRSSLTIWISISPLSCISRKLRISDEITETNFKLNLVSLTNYVQTG